MATYYVDSVNGLDANNGLGPDASAGTNKPWKTIGKALGASGIASGDTVYLSPAGPFRETVSVAMTSAVAETKVLGDPGNAQGFKTSGGAAVAPGPITWTAYTTNDKTVPAASPVLNLNGKNFLTFQYILFVGGATANTVQAATGTSTHITFNDCAFLSRHTSGFPCCIQVTQAAIGPYTWMIDRCLFMQPAAAQGVDFRAPLNVANTDYDVVVTIQNSRFVAGHSATAINLVASGGSGTGKMGGLKSYTNTFVNGVTGIAVTSANSGSTTIPVLVKGCLFFGCSVGVNANTAGQITEDYTIFNCATARTNVTAGTHSISDGSYAPLFHFGQESVWGRLLRPFGEPSSASPLLGFGNDGSQTAYDGLNRPRPAGGASASPAAGALERGNTAVQATSPAPAAGTHVWQGTGPWYQDFQLPVNTTATTIAIDEQHDANYTGTLPSLLILAQPEIGVSAQTVASVGSSGANNTVTSAQFTPTAAGWITVRLSSLDTSGISVVSFSNVVVT